VLRKDSWIRSPVRHGAVGDHLCARPQLKAWEAFDEVDLVETLGRTHLVTQQALALRNEASPVECALIDALPARHQSPEPPASIEVLNRWNDDYADAMRVVYNDYGIDLGIAALFAEALLKQRCRTLDGVGYTANYRGDT
jgi:hypothetical protein